MGWQYNDPCLKEWPRSAGVNECLKTDAKSEGSALQDCFVSVLLWLLWEVLQFDQENKLKAIAQASVKHGLKKVVLSLGDNSYFWTIVL